jgi:16S rRNA (cytosine1402-N4)-methyltransferase
MSGSASEPDGFRHDPVLAEEIVSVFSTVPAGAILDATLGGGGHAALLLESRPDCVLVGLDRDPDARAAAARRLAPFGSRAVLVRRRFADLAIVMRQLHSAGSVTLPLSGALFDLGVSSPQLDRAERGFSYRGDGPLDMRMDPDQPWSAADLVNGADEAALARVLRDNADERFAARIARAIVAARPIETTAELADVVRSAIPSAARRRGGHPAKRTFQALRIAVNDELAQLPGALDDAVELLQPGGRVAVISYHSGEDRIVKHRFRLASTGGCTCPSGLPCACGALRTVRVLRPGGVVPSAEEIVRNPRAASARLRVAEKLAG